MTNQKFLGFYWTLPVPWVGFRDLPNDVDAAAEKSLTIRYQRDRVRKWVVGEKAELFHEEVYIEVEPDRVTGHLQSVVGRLLDRCRKEDAVLVFVDFSSVFGWRSNKFVLETLKLSNEHKPDLFVNLYPDEIVMDGKIFDPIRHFKSWRQRQKERIISKPERIKILLEAIFNREETWNLPLTTTELAKVLNRDGLRTLTGKEWNNENLRKFIKQHADASE